MRRYYFHLVTLSERSIDANGTDLADLAAARRHALRELGEVLADFPDAFTSIEVTDSRGDLVHVTSVNAVDVRATNTRRA